MPGRFSQTAFRAWFLATILTASFDCTPYSSALAQLPSGSADEGVVPQVQPRTPRIQQLRFRLRTLRGNGEPLKLLAHVNMTIASLSEFNMPQVEVIGFESLDAIEGGYGAMAGMGGYGGYGSQMGAEGGMGMDGSAGMGGMPGMDGGMGMGMPGAHNMIDLSRLFTETTIDMLTQRVQGMAYIHWCSQQFGDPSAELSSNVLEQYRKKLAELLQAEYKIRLDNKEKELRNLEAQVASLRKDLVRRQKATSDVVAFEVQRRVLGAQGLEMNADELSPYSDGAAMGDGSMPMSGDMPGAEFGGAAGMPGMSGGMPGKASSSIKNRSRAKK